jgi:hypothetical protein
MPNLYSDEFRAQAYLALIAANYPKRGALAQVAAALNVPKHTLRRWAEKRPIRRKRQAQIDLQQLMLSEVHHIIGQLPAKRNQASYRELTATLTAMVNGVRGLDTLSPELLECGPLLAGIVEHVKTIGWDVRHFFESMEDELAQEVARREEKEKLESAMQPDRDHQ